MPVAVPNYEGGVPVFRPSMAEFEDFYAYMKQINEFGLVSGIVKVIPPKEWHQALPPVSEQKLRSVKIKNPIVQHINGTTGVFSSQNIEKSRTYNIVQWKALSEERNNQPPAPRGKLRKSVDYTTEKWNKKILNWKVAEEEMFQGFDHNIDTSEFTADRCEQLEKVYWKSLTFVDPMYGADMLGSLFEDSVKVWNVGHLPNVLDHLDERIPGVNDAYLYAGLWKASFSWHLEDQDLYSINYLHFGAPKQWYSIPRKYKDKFDTLMRDLFPEEYANCPDFLRHKTFLASPSFLKSKGIIVNRIVHRQGEFMITYPYGYHAGMNFGYNLAEAVNFAIDDWFEYGLKTTKCLCISDAVNIDVPKLIRKFKGEPEPESEDLTPTPAVVVKKKPNSIRLNVSSKRELSATSEILPQQHQQKKIKSQRDSSINSPISQCQLCPNNLPPRLFQYDHFRLLPTQESLEQGKPKFCHSICAMLIPETSIIQDDQFGDMVVGSSSIPKARRTLKCLYCQQKNGFCFQCSNPKCIRAYHGTCSLPAGVELHEGNSNNVCKYHRDKDLKVDYNDIRVGDIIQGKFGNSDFFAGMVMAKNKSEETLYICPFPMIDDSTVMEIPISSVTYQGLGLFTSLRPGRPRRGEEIVKNWQVEHLSLSHEEKCSWKFGKLGDLSIVIETARLPELAPLTVGYYEFLRYTPPKSSDCDYKANETQSKKQNNGKCVSGANTSGILTLSYRVPMSRESGVVGDVVTDSSSPWNTGISTPSLVDEQFSKPSGSVLLHEPQLMSQSSPFPRFPFESLSCPYPNPYESSHIPQSCCPTSAPIPGYLMAPMMTPQGYLIPPMKLPQKSPMSMSPLPPVSQLLLPPPLLQK